MSDIKSLYINHIKNNIQSTNKALNALKYDGVIFGSGKEYFYFEDDMSAPFRTNPHFAHWCPAKGPNHFLKYSIGQKPLLVYYSPNDFWHIHERFENPFWADMFDVRIVTSVDQLWKNLGSVSNHIFIGEDTKYAQTDGLKINCELLTARLNWYRRQKTPYEIYCIKKANEKASLAHKTAKKSFLSGKSEYEIHMDYLQTLGESDSDLPYPGIVGLNENAAVLHYHGRQHKKHGNVLLIDSGASYLGYHADITRTYVSDRCSEIFKKLFHSMEILQKQLCSEVKLNAFFPDLHLKCHLILIQALHELGILKNLNPQDYQELIEDGLTKTFLPHGLGHMIGVQVHDIGGKQLDEEGNPAPELEKKTLYKSLRYMGTLEENNVITIEPGVYFIPMLLDQLKSNSKHAQFVNWKLVEDLVPYGGIRIEDEVFPTVNGPCNITREFLP